MATSHRCKSTETYSDNAVPRKINKKRLKATVIEQRLQSNTAHNRIAGPTLQGFVISFDSDVALTEFLPA